MGVSAPVTPRKPVLRPMLLVSAVMALLSLTGAPTPKTLARLADAGVPGDLAATLLHVTPTLIAMAGLGVGLLLGRGRGPMVRAIILALAGGLIGFLTAFCLDLFVGFLPLMERLTGPLREANGLDVATWCLAVLSIVYGGLTFALAGFGTPAMKAIDFEGADAECLELRTRDRGTFAQASVGLMGQGVFLGALAVLHQLAPDASGSLRGGAVVTLTLGVLAFAWSSWVIWRGMDELMRRTVVQTYAWSGLLATVGGLVWAVLEGLKLAAPLTAYALIVALIFVQTMTSMLITAGFGAPATARKGAR